MKHELLATPNDMALTVMRIVLGIVFFAHGAQKVLGWFGGGGFQATLTGMTGMGLPAVLVILVMMAEFLGGIGLIVGLLGRIAAAGVACVMLGAIFLVHLQFGLFMNWTGQQQGEGYEFHLLALAICVAIIVHGSGALSIDRAVAGGRPIAAR